MVPPLAVLQAHNIEIDDDPGHIGDLPPYAKGLRDLLLNFEGIVPLNKKLKLESLYEKDNDLKDSKSPLPPVPRNIYRDSGHRTYQARWDAAQALRHKAQDLAEPHAEAPWSNLMTNFVFENFNEQSSDQVTPMKDQISLGFNQLFSNAVSIRETLSDDNDHQPKPDFWFGLRLFKDEQLSRLKGLERTDKDIEYFTTKFLKKIGTDHRNPFMYQPVKSSEHMAFPWMVAELKKESGDELECRRQAANASHMCLVLCEQLAASVTRDASPIVAFTSVGPEVKMFITYKSENAGENCYRMSCIWSGNIRNILHAVQIRRIVDQLMFWALRIFKPWVTDCLDGWCKKEINKSETVAFSQKSSKLRTVEVVDQNISKLEIAEWLSQISSMIKTTELSERSFSRPDIVDFGQSSSRPETARSLGQISSESRKVELPEQIPSRLKTVEMPGQKSSKAETGGSLFGQSAPVSTTSYGLSGQTSSKPESNPVPVSQIPIKPFDQISSKPKPNPAPVSQTPFKPFGETSSKLEPNSVPFSQTPFKPFGETSSKPEPDAVPFSQTPFKPFGETSSKPEPNRVPFGQGPFKSGFSGRSFDQSSSKAECSGGSFGQNSFKPKSGGGGFFGQPLFKSESGGGGVFGNIFSKPESSDGGLFSQTPFKSKSGDEWFGKTPLKPESNVEISNKGSSKPESGTGVDFFSKIRSVSTTGGEPLFVPSTDRSKSPALECQSLPQAQGKSATNLSHQFSSSVLTEVHSESSHASVISIEVSNDQDHKDHDTSHPKCEDQEMSNHEDSNHESSDEGSSGERSSDLAFNDQVYSDQESGDDEYIDQGSPDQGSSEYWSSESWSGESWSSDQESGDRASKDQKSSDQENKDQEHKDQENNNPSTSKVPIISTFKGHADCTSAVLIGHSLVTQCKAPLCPSNCS